MVVWGGVASNEVLTVVADGAGAIEEIVLGGNDEALRGVFVMVFS